jgi:hypothetical protein
MRTRLVFASAISLALGVLALAPAVSADPRLEGPGNAVADLGLIKESVIIDFTFTGSSSVVVTPVFSKDKRATPWLESGAPLTGSVFVEKHSSPLVGAKIRTTDQWTLQVSALGSAPKATSGSIPQVIQLPKMKRSESSRTFTHRGRGEVVVFPISAKGVSGFSVVNSSGNVKKKITLPRGTKFISVWANGPWKFSK